MWILTSIFTISWNNTKEQHTDTYEVLFLSSYKMETTTVWDLSKWFPMYFYYQLWNERVEYQVDIPRYIAIPILVRTIVCHWMMFKKAWLPGWWAIIPFYNIYLQFKMSWMSGWWILSLLFPPLFLVVYLVSLFKLPAKFGRHWAWGFGLFFFYPIFIGIFAFDKSKYKH